MKTFEEWAEFIVCPEIRFRYLVNLNSGLAVLRRERNGTQNSHGSLAMAVDKSCSWSQTP